MWARVGGDGLPLICVPKVPVGNAENHRVRHSQAADFPQLSVRSGPEIDTPASADSALHSPFRSVNILWWPFIIPIPPDERRRAQYPDDCVAHNSVALSATSKSQKIAGCPASLCSP